MSTSCVNLPVAKQSSRCATAYHLGGRLLPGDVPAQKGQSGQMARHGFYREVNATFDDEIYYRNLDAFTPLYFWVIAFPE